MAAVTRCQLDGAPKLLAGLCIIPVVEGIIETQRGMSFRGFAPDGEGAVRIPAQLQAGLRVRNQPVRSVAVSSCFSCISEREARIEGDGAIERLERATH